MAAAAKAEIDGRLAGKFHSTVSDVMPQGTRGAGARTHVHRDSVRHQREALLHRFRQKQGAATSLN